MTFAWSAAPDALVISPLIEAERATERAHQSSTYAPVAEPLAAKLTGGNTLDGSQSLQSSVTGAHPLRVWANKQDGNGLLERFTVENTPGGGGCDVNFRNVDVNFGSPAIAYAGMAKFYGPAATTYQPIRIFTPGSTTTLCAQVASTGRFSAYVGSTDSVAFEVSTYAAANQTFTVGNDGKHQWGVVGGATAMDTTLYRDAAGVLRTDGKILATSFGAKTGNWALLDSVGSARITIRTTDVLFSSVLIFGAGNNFTFDTSSGTKLGTAANQKLAFYGATAIVQPSATPADATDLATVLTLANDLRTKLLALGLVA